MLQAWAPPGKWKKFHLLIRKRLRKPCGINVELTAVGACNGNKCWRVDGQDHAESENSFMVGDGAPVSGKMSCASLSWVPECELEETEQMIQLNSVNNAVNSGRSDLSWPSSFCYKMLDNNQPGEEYDLSDVMSDVIPSKELDLSDRLHGSDEDDEDDY